MPVASGSTFAQYRLTEKIGAGGMGEVWRAADSRLGRDVAIKVLPDEFTRDPERLARFQREARLLASLNHPHIATIHGLEEGQGAAGLVMELVPGEDLAQRLVRGPMPIEEALPVARQIAEALEYAHEHGIIHRDLKPANIRLTPEGQVKVLDFGLAKAMTGDATASGQGGLSLSPTLTARATAVGVILGTAAYMSPEQAKGKGVDRRADLWAFGCVLYEMLTASRAFAGETLSETMASVLKDEPDWGALPGGTPAGALRLLRRCLAKDPARRLRSAADAVLDLDSGEEPAGPAPTTAPRSRLVPWAGWGIAALLAVALLAARALQGDEAPSESPRAVEIGVPQGLTLSDLAPPAISADGKWVVFSAASAGEPAHLWLRSLEAFEAVDILGTEGAIFPFWSPDSRHVGYFKPGEMWRLDVATQIPRLICACAPWGRGGTWTEDDTILFSPHANSAIMAIPAAGGEPVPLTEIDPSLPDGSHRFPVILPDQEHFLYLVWSNSAEALAEKGGIHVLSRRGGTPRKVLSDASSFAFVPPGALLVHRSGRLIAIPFDPGSLAAGTDGITVAPEVRFGSSSGEVYASVSSTGHVLYVEGETRSGKPMDLVWLDRRGVPEPATDRPLAARALDLSPDARRFAALVEPQETGSLDLWVGEFARGTVIRLTTGINDSLSPRWSPDGKWLAYMNRDSGDDDLYRIRSDGTGVPERLFEGRDLDTYITDWSADGTLLLFNGMEKTGQRRSRIWGLDLARGEARMILEGDRASVNGARLSPDGRWLAHVSDESGEPEVYIRPFPGLDRKWQVSRQGGDFPHWRQDVRELTYIGPAASIFAVPLAPHGDDIGLGSPILLFTPTRLDLSILPSAREAVETISPRSDHSRFLASLSPADRAELPLRLILDWAARRPDQGVTSAPSRSR